MKNSGRSYNVHHLSFNDLLLSENQKISNLYKDLWSLNALQSSTESSILATFKWSEFFGYKSLLKDFKKKRLKLRDQKKLLYDIEGNFLDTLDHIIKFHKRYLLDRIIDDNSLGDIFLNDLKEFYPEEYGRLRVSLRNIFEEYFRIDNDGKFGLYVRNRTYKDGGSINLEDKKVSDEILLPYVEYLKKLGNEKSELFQAITELFDKNAEYCRYYDNDTVEKLRYRIDDLIQKYIGKEMVDDFLIRMEPFAKRRKELLNVVQALHTTLEKTVHHAYGKLYN